MTRSDRFERCVTRLHMLNLKAEQIEKALNMAANVQTAEAERSFIYAEKDIETAEYWMDKAIRELGTAKP